MAKATISAPAAVETNLSADHVIQWARAVGDSTPRDATEIMLDLPEVLTAMLKLGLSEQHAPRSLAECSPMMRSIALLACMAQDSLDALTATRH